MAQPTNFPDRPAAFRVATGWCGLGTLLMMVAGCGAGPSGTTGADGMKATGGARATGGGNGAGGMNGTAGSGGHLATGGASAAGTGGTNGSPASGGAAVGAGGAFGVGSGGVNASGGAGNIGAMGGGNGGGGRAVTGGATGSGGASGSAGGIGSGPLVPGTIGVTVANFMMAKWPELDAAASDCTGPTNCFSLNYASAPAAPAPKFWEYTYGVPLYGVQKLYERTGQAKYLQYVKKYVDRYITASGGINYGRSWPAGNSPSEPTSQDIIQPSILLFGMHLATKDARYLTAMATTRAVIKSMAKNSAGAFWHKPSYPHQQWLDGIYMTQPFLVKYGALYADQAAPGDAGDCFSTATFQIKLLAQRTFNSDKSLYFHAWNGAPDGKWLGLAPPARVPPLDGIMVSPVLWSRAIAWFIAGTVDVLDDLPKDHPDRPQLIEIVKNMAAGLKRFQDPATGLWYQVIDVMNGPPPPNGGYPRETVAAAPNWLETSASAIFAYSLAKGVRLGYLPVEYLAVAKTAWAGVKTKIDLGANGAVNIRGTVVGMSVGGTYNAYANADFRSDLGGNLPAPAPAGSCPVTVTAGTSTPLGCKYIYVRDNVPQGFGAVLLAAAELEF